jgi:hypothetical protein
MNHIFREQIFASMDIINLIAKASQHLLVCRPSDLKPMRHGSGCIVLYKNRKFLLTVAHVTDHEGEATCIETGLPTEELQTPIYSVGAMCYVDLYKVPPDVRQREIRRFEDLSLMFDETLEISFCEIKEDIAIIQPEWDFGAYKIVKGPKVYLNLHEAGEPDREKLHGLCGRIKPETRGITIVTTPTLKLDLEYVQSFGRFHLFSVPELISDSDDYRGCSGAPILDETGKLVGLLQSVLPNSNSIFAFSIEECKRLLDWAIEAKLL